jgi:hypothetical protein
MKLFLSAVLAVSSLVSTTVRAEEAASFPGVEPMVCSPSDTMKTCAVLKLEPAALTIDTAGDLQIAIAKDTRCPHLARCFEAGQIVLSISLTPVGGGEKKIQQHEYRRNQNNAVDIELDDGSIVKLDILAITPKVSGMPLEFFEAKLDYSIDSM